MSAPATKRALLLSLRIQQMENDLGEVVAARNLAIREARAGGETIAELSSATGLSRTMLYRIIDKEES